MKVQEKKNNEVVNSVVSPIKEPKENDFMPKFTVSEVPSKFKSYPEGCKIEYSVYRFGDLKRMSGSELSPHQIYSDILMGVECNNFDKRKITFPDLNYIGVLRKVSSIGGLEFSAQFVCPFCDDSEFQNKEFEIKDLDFFDLEVPNLPINVKFSFGVRKFMPYTFEDFEFLRSINKELDKTAILAIMSISSKIFRSNKEREDAFNKRFDEFDNMEDPTENYKLDKVDKMLGHGLKPLSVYCNNEGCISKEKKLPIRVDLDLEGLELVVTPTRKFRESVENCFSFGNSEGS